MSSILPSNARVTSVDMSDAHPVRPGAPKNGAPEGTTSVKDRVTLNSSAKDAAIRETLTYKNPKEAKRAKIAEAVTKKFFETRVPQTLKEETKAPSLVEESMDPVMPMETKFKKSEMPTKLNEISESSLKEIAEINSAPVKTEVDSFMAEPVKAMSFSAKTTTAKVETPSTVEKLDKVSEEVSVSEPKSLDL